MLFRTACLILLILLVSLSGWAQCDNSSQENWIINGHSGMQVRDAAYNAQGDLLVCGYSGSSAFILYFNQTASVKWAKAFTSSSSIVFRKIIPMSDGGIAVAGYFIANPTAMMVMRLDGNGVVQWTKRLWDNSAVPGLTNQSVNFREMIETPDGGIALSGRKTYKRPDNAFNNRIIVLKLNSDGSIAWTREDTHGNEDEAFGIISHGGSIIVVGTTYIPAHVTRYGFFEKLNPADGAVQNLKLYKLGSLNDAWFRSIEKAAGGFLIGAQTWSGSSLIYTSLKTDYDGNPVDVKHLPPFGPALLNQFYHPFQLSDGSILLMKGEWLTQPQVQMAKISPAGTAAWHYEYTMPGSNMIDAVLPDANGGALAVGTSSDPGGRILLMKLASNGNMASCPKTALPFSVKDSLFYTTSSSTWQTTALSFQPPYDITVASSTLTLSNSVVCQPAPVCQLKEIKGMQTICRPDTTITYTLSSNGNCSPATWNLSSPIGIIQPVNDSMVNITFTQAGTAQLTAQTANACGSFSKQILIDYRPMSGQIELGEDRTICPLDTATLSVTGPFATYLWNTGSTANNIRVTAPGTYDVSVTNDGVCFLKDTVKINLYPKPVVNLPDVGVLCKPGSIELDAGPGFDYYTWQDGSNQPVFTVNTTGTYWVKVKDGNGCTASDTVKILTEGTKPVSFVSFSDTTICNGADITLTLNQNFNSYRWNNGESTASSFTTNRTGKHYVEVTTAEGCTGKDSIEIKQKFCTSELYIPNAFSPNGDRKNDVFRCISTAPLDLYELKIYNRWGELLFETKDIQKGWDGVYKNFDQSQHVFAWVVRYRFAGSNETILRKGTMILLR